LGVSFVTYTIERFFANSSPVDRHGGNRIYGLSALTARTLLPSGGRPRRLGELICQYLDKEVRLLIDGDKALNISSDIEVSSFGLLKSNMPTCRMVGFTECVLRLPLYSRLKKYSTG
jgi:hypothetical protein